MQPAFYANYVKNVYTAKAKWFLLLKNLLLYLSFFKYRLLNHKYFK
jgi:hypothetical protein